MILSGQLNLYMKRIFAVYLDNPYCKICVMNMRPRETCTIEFF